MKLTFSSVKNHDSSNMWKTTYNHNLELELTDVPVLSGRWTAYPETTQVWRRLRHGIGVLPLTNWVALRR